MPTKKRALIGSAAALLLFPLAACTSPSLPSGESTSKGTQVVEVDEPYANASLDELGAASDLIVRGTVSAIEHGLKLGEDTTVDYKVYLVDAGSKSPVSVVVSEAFDGVPTTVEGRPELSVGDEAIWTLRKLDAEFNFDGYVLVSSSSVFPTEGDSILTSTEDTAASEAAELGADETLARLTDAAS